MNNRYYMITVIAITMLSFVIAQDPPDLPGAPNQGPIGGMIWLAIGGVAIAVKKYYSHKTDK
jgi:hypothetical protein